MSESMDIMQKNYYVSEHHKKIMAETNDDGFVCPITQEIIKIPGMLITGSLFELDEITKWLINNDTDPCTNELLVDKTITRNFWELYIFIDPRNTQVFEEARKFYRKESIDDIRGNILFVTYCREMMKIRQKNVRDRYNKNKNPSLIFSEKKEITLRNISKIKNEYNVKNQYEWEFVQKLLQYLLTTNSEELKILNNYSFGDFKNHASYIKRPENTGKDFQFVDLKNFNIEDKFIKGYCFDCADLTGSKWTNCQFNTCSFTLSKMNNVEFINVKFNDCVFFNASVEGVKFVNCNIDNANKVNREFNSTDDYDNFIKQFNARC